MASGRFTAAKGADYNEPVDPYRCYLFGPTHDGKEGEKFTLESFYSEREVQAVEEDLRWLFRHFKSGYFVAQAHATPSSSWRDETAANLEHSALSRFGVRLHVYETHTGDSGQSPVNRPAGRYLGFVILRPPSRDGEPLDRIGFKYVLEAELLPPRHTQRPRYHIIRTTASSSRMGVLPFLSTVFMTPDEDASTCVHLAISQALHLIMGRFGAIPISQREFEIELWKRAPTKSLDTLSKSGASLSEALEIVRDRCRTGGFVVDLNKSSGSSFVDQASVWKESLRVITDALASGLPVIVMANHRELTKLSSQAGGGRNGSMENLPHGALIFGMRLLNSGSELGAHSGSGARQSREDESELPGIFLGHDTYFGPYTEWTTEQLFRAALACPTDDGSSPGIRFLVLGPRDMKLGLDKARYISKQLVLQEYAANPGLFDQYRKRFGLRPGRRNSKPESPVQWRFVTRLMTTDEIQRVYQPRPLTWRRADVGMLGESAAAFDRRKGYWWVVEVFLPVYGRTAGTGIRNKAALIYVFDVSQEWDERSTHLPNPIVLELDLESLEHQRREGLHE